MSAIDTLTKHAGGPALVSSRTLKQLVREITESAPLNPASMSVMGTGFTNVFSGRPAPARMMPLPVPDGVVILGPAAVKKLHVWMRPRLLSRPAEARPGGSQITVDEVVNGNPPSTMLTARPADISSVAARARQMRPLTDSRARRH